MTIADTSRKAGPFVGDGQTVSFPFNFRIFSEDQLIVLKSSSASEDVRLSRGIDYRVDLNVNQDVDAGGNVILTSPLAQGANLAILSNVPYSQETIFTNKGGFYPAQLNEALDKSTALVQQLHEKLDRALTVPATQTKTPIEIIDELFTSEARSREQAGIASASAAAASASQSAARSSELAAKASEKNAKASETAASLSEQRTIAVEARTSQLVGAALASQQAAKASESAAQVSETNASNSEAHALLYMQKAKAWAVNDGVVEGELESSKTYAERAGASQASAQASAERAAVSESNAKVSAESAQTAANLASESELNSRTYSKTAQTSAQSAQSSLSIVQALKSSVDASKTEVDTVVAQLNNPTAEISIVGENESAGVSVARNASDVHWTFVIPRGHTGATGLKGDKGDKGDRGEKGDKGDKGDPLHWDDLTEEQKSQLKVTLPDDLVNDAELSAALMPYSKTADVSNTYATKTALGTVDGKFANYTTTSALNTKLGSYLLKTDASSTYATKAELSAVNSDLGTKVAKTGDRGVLSGWEKYTVVDVPANGTYNVTEDSPDVVHLRLQGTCTINFRQRASTTADVPIFYQKILLIEVVSSSDIVVNWGLFGATWSGNSNSAPVLGKQGDIATLLVQEASNARCELYAKGK